MQLVNNKIYFNWNQLTSIVSENTLKANRFRRNENWNFIKDEKDNRVALLEYEPLPFKYRSLIKENLCGGLEPIEYYKSQHLQEHIKPVAKELSNLHSYKPTLSEDEIKRYHIEAKYLNFLKHLNKNSAKNYGFDGKLDCVRMVVAIANSEGAKLPVKPCNLNNKIAAYIKYGVFGIIDNRKANNNALKHGKYLDENGNKQYSTELEIQFNALVRQLYGSPNCTSITETWRQITNFRNERNMAPLSVRQINNLMNKKQVQVQLHGQRLGEKKFNDLYSYSIGRKHASSSMLLIELDGYDMNLWYRKMDASGKTISHSNTKNVVVVIDAYNGYFLGYFIADTETAEGQKQAVKNAIKHIYQLTGEWVLPYQIKTDNFGRGANTEFYKSVSHYTPAKAGNARSKTIEQEFNKFKNAVLKKYYNYSGSNITSTTDVNRDWKSKVKSDFPNEDENIKQIDEAIESYRHYVDPKTGKSKQQVWLDGFKAMDSQKKCTIDKQSYLKLFGESTGKTNTLKKEGLSATILGIKCQYALLEDSFMETIGTEYTILFDRDDLSEILAIDAAGNFWVLPEKELMPMCIADTKEGDRAKIDKQLKYQKDFKQRQISKNVSDRKILDDAGIENELKLTYGKHAIQSASQRFNALPESTAAKTKKLTNKVKSDFSPYPVDENRVIRVLGNEHRNK